MGDDAALPVRVDRAVLLAVERRTRARAARPAALHDRRCDRIGRARALADLTEASRKIRPDPPPLTAAALERD